LLRVYTRLGIDLNVYFDYITVKRAAPTRQSLGRRERERERERVGYKKLVSQLKRVSTNLFTQFGII